MSRKTKRLYLKAETTGSHPIVNGVYRISCVFEVDGKQVETFDSLLKPIDSVDINLDTVGVSMEELQSYPEHIDVNLSFRKLLEKVDTDHHPYVKFTPVCVGNTFDFITNWMYMYPNTHWDMLQNFRQVDPLSLVRLMCDWGDKELKDLANHRMDTLCYFFKIPVPKPGLDSVLAVREVYKQLTRRMASMVRGTK